MQRLVGLGSWLSIGVGAWLLAASPAPCLAADAPAPPPDLTWLDPLIGVRPGDLPETVSVSLALQLRNWQEDARTAILEMPAAERGPWIELFYVYLTQADRFIATRPLQVDLADGRQLLVRNHTDLMMQLVARYGLMEQSAGRVDFRRFAGVSPEDVAGLDTLSEHLEARRFDGPLQIAVFDLLSPLGNLQLMDRLIRKFATAPITRIEGKAEVVQPSLLRYVDGTGPAYEQALQAVRQAFEDHPAPLPEAPLTEASLWEALEAYSSLQGAVKAAALGVIDGFSGETVFRDVLAADITALANAGGDGLVGYAARWGAFTRFLEDADVRYTIGNRTVTVPVTALTDFANGLPYDQTTLFRYPGIASDLSPDALDGLIPDAWYRRLAAISLHEDSDAVADERFSYPARRVQLPGLLLQIWADEVVGGDGRVDWDRLRALMLLNAQLEAALEETEAYLAGREQELKALAPDGVLDPEAYVALKELLAAAREELVTRFSPLLENVVYDARNEVTNRVNSRYQALAAAADDLLEAARIRVPLSSGVSVEAEPRQLWSGALLPVLRATALPIEAGAFGRSAYLRLHGIDAPLLAPLPTPIQWSTLMSFSFYEATAPWDRERVAESELLFRLLPELVGRVGTDDPDALAAYLAQGVPLPVPVGRDLQEELKGRVRGRVRDVLQCLAAADTASPAGLEAIQACAAALGTGLPAAVRSLVAGLSDGEQRWFEQWVNWQWGEAENLRAFRQQFDSRIGSVSWLDVDGIRVPVAAVLAIPAFPWSRDYDRELFPGLSPSDFDGAETWDQANRYRYFTLGEGWQGATSSLSSLGRLQVVAALIHRLVVEDGEAANTAGIFVERDGRVEVDTEALRLFLKGVAVMQARLEALAAAICAEATTALEAAAAPAMTAAEIDELYQTCVLDTRTALVTTLQTEAGRHERQDVMRVENPVSLRFQNGLFSRFVELVGQATIVAESPDGTAVSVPVAAIAAALTARLTEQLGAPPAAHDFARFYGISLDQVRGLHKLENYLGEQVVALPQHSESVAVVSHLSELGMIQLAADLVQRYGPDITAPDGGVDVARLLELLGDRDRAVAALRQRLAAVAADTVRRCAALGRPLSPADVETLATAMDDAKLALLALVNDFLSGLPAGQAEGLHWDLEALVNSHYEALKQQRDALLSDRGVAYDVQLEGGPAEVVLRLDEDRVGRFVETVAAIARTVADQPAADARAGDMLLPQPLLMSDAVPVSEVRGGAIWCPVPAPDYDPANHPTTFGMAVLLTRLAVRYGDFAVTLNADGVPSFDMDRFETELQRRDQDRAERRLDRILANELPRLREGIAAARDPDGALPVAAVPAQTETFLEVKARIAALAPDAWHRASEVWADFVDLYETALFGGALSFRRDALRLVFNAAELDAVVQRVDEAGSFDPSFFSRFAAMVDEGETTWDYDRFRYLSWPRPWLDSFLGSAPAGASAAADEPPANPAAAGDFTLGDIVALPGIGAADIASLDVAEKDWLRVTVADPATLLGLLDMRALAPGSGVRVDGLLKTSAVNSDALVADGASAAPAEAVEPSPAPGQLRWRSQRFRVVELIPAMVAVAAEPIWSEAGVIDPEAFQRLLEGGVPHSVEWLYVQAETDPAAADGGSVAVFRDGTDVCRLVATPSAGFVFARWLGDLEGIDDVRAAETSCRAIGSRTVYARFVRADERPVPHDDLLQVPCGGTVSVDFRDNDWARAGAQLTVTIDTPPRFGELTASGDGAFSFHAPADFVGTETLSYRVADEWLESEKAATVTVTVTYPDSGEVSLRRGWNLVSTPCRTAFREMLAADPDVGEGDAVLYAWDGLGYLSASVFEPGSGYWVCLSSASRGERQTVAVYGEPAPSHLTRLAAGWNLVGALTACPVPANGLVLEPWWWWDADAECYEPAVAGDILLPGRGYWVYARRGCDIPVGPAPQP